MRTMCAKCALLTLAALTLYGCSDTIDPTVTFLNNSTAVAVANPILPSAPTPPLKAVSVGQLTGLLSDDIAQVLSLQTVPTNQISLVGLPLVVGQGALTLEVLDQLAASFRAGHPIVLVSPTQADLDRVRTALGLSGSLSAAGVQLYGADKGLYGDVYEQVVDETSSTLQGTEEVITQSGASIVPMLETALDGNDSQLARAKVLADWVADDPARDLQTQQQVAQAKSLDKISSSSDLRKIGVESNFRATFSFQGNTHDLGVSVWSAHDLDRDVYYFFVEQTGLLSAANAYKHDTAYHQGWFTDLYKLNAIIPDAVEVRFPTDRSAQPQPPTAQRNTQFNSKTSHSLSGKVGINAKVSDKTEAGGSAEVTGGTSWESGQSWNVPDVSIANQSGSSGRNAAWDFEILRPTFDRITFSFLGCVFDPKVTRAAAVGRATFEPLTSWVWEVPASVRQKYPTALPIDFFFQTRLGNLERDPDCHFRDRKLESPVYSHRVYVKWPPASAP